MSIVANSALLKPIPKRLSAVFSFNTALLKATVTDCKSLPVPADTSKATFNNFCASLASKVELTN